MPDINIQIIAGREITALVAAAREVARREFNIGENATITNGYVLNAAIRSLSGSSADFSDLDYWESVSKADAAELAPSKVDNVGETMKFRLAGLSGEKLSELSQALSEGFGSRIRKNYLVKLVLKAYLIEHRSKQNA